jgi:hypothetical protein
VVSRFELTGAILYDYRETPFTPKPLKVVAESVEERAERSRKLGYRATDCRCCRQSFTRASGNTLDCPTCRAFVPKVLRVGPPRAEWNVRGVYLLSHRVRRTPEEKHRAAIQQQRLRREMARRERLTALRAGAGLICFDAPEVSE